MDKKILILGVAGGAVLAALAVFAVLAVAGILALSYFGFFGAAGPRAGGSQKDLGVQAGGSDLNSSNAALQSFLNGSSKGVLEMTDEEFTALIASRANGTLKNPQFKFNPDGTFEASGTLNESYFNAPLYMKGRVVLLSEREIGLDISKAELGGFALPDSQASELGKVAKGFSEDYFASNPDAKLDSISVQEGKMILRGSFG